MDDHVNIDFQCFEIIAISKVCSYDDVGGVQLILYSIDSGNMVKSVKITPQESSYIEPVDAKCFQENDLSDRLDFDKEIYGSTMKVLKDGNRLNWWNAYKNGLKKR